MILLLAVAVAVLFGTGAMLMLKRDLIRVVAGVIMISNAANLFLMSAGLFRGRAPILPVAGDRQISDPLVQAMTLTAVVITFGVAALLLSLVYRVYTSHHSIDQEDLMQAEEHEIATVQHEEELV